MTQHTDSSGTHPAVEAIFKKGFDGIADSLRLLFNEAMKIERSAALQANEYERNDQRTGYANGYKNKTMQTRVGAINFDIPQVRGDIKFYPHAIEKGLRTERALNLAICEMYVQGVSTRKVEPILAELAGVQVSREKVSQVAQELDEELEAWRQRKLDWVQYMVVDARCQSALKKGPPSASKMGPLLPVIFWDFYDELLGRPCAQLGFFHLVQDRAMLRSNPSGISARVNVLKRKGESVPFPMAFLY